MEINLDSGGTQKNIGGIVAKNFGLIENCIFNGEIKGKEGRYWIQLYNV